MRSAALAVAFLFSLGCSHSGPSALSPPAAPPSLTDACTPLRPSSSSSFELVVLGSGGPVSSGRAASGYVVLVDGVARALVDVGPGAFLRLGQLGLDLRRLDAILLTHLHVDHSGDVPGVVKARDLSFDDPLVFRFFGPAAGGDYPSTPAFVDRLFGKEGAFAYLGTFRNRLTLDAVELPIAASAPVHEVLRDADLHVTSVAVDHGDVPAVAFRVEHGGRAVVVSGDLASKNDNLAHLAEGADLLVYDTTVLDPPASPPVLYELHTAPRRIGEVAAAAHVKSLLLGHVTWDVERSADAVLRSVHAHYTGPTRLASDCLRVALDAGR